MSEPPSPDGRRSRSDAAARLAALLADVGDEAPAPPEPAPPRPARRGRAREEGAPVDDGPVDDGGEATVRYDLRSLDRLLDGGDGGSEPAPGGPGGRGVFGDLDASDDVEAFDPLGSDERDDLAGSEGPDRSDSDDVSSSESEPESESGPPDGGGAPPERRRRVTLRAVAFGVALAVLVAAVPVLGVVGAQRLSESRGGNVTQGDFEPHEPGYLAIVVPTRTALLVHRTSDGELASATLLALNADDVGGTVLQIPLNTQMRNGRYLMTRLVHTYDYEHDLEAFYREVQDRLGVAIDEKVDLSDGQIAELVRPVAPLTFDNPDSVVLEDGRTLSSGRVELAAEDVGPFLRGNGEAESELARLARNEVVWEAWLSALGAAGGGSGGAVTAATVLSPFLQGLAAGSVEAVDMTRVETLDVGPQPDSDEPTLVPAEGFAAQVNAAVPYPRSPGPGRRYALKLLNGVDGNVELPRAVMHDLVMGGAALTQVGNAVEFGQERSKIEIVSDAWRSQAEVANVMLGGDAVIEVMDEVEAADVDVDVVITVGRDALEVYEERSGG